MLRYTLHFVVTLAFCCKLHTACLLCVARHVAHVPLAAASFCRKLRCHVDHLLLSRGAMPACGLCKSAVP